MKAYLIDFENVKSKGLTGIEQLSEDDKVIIFYSENSDTISFEMHRKVMTSKADIEYLKVRVGGKNALDFQLSTLLGYLLAKEIYSHILIISGDKGFDKLHDFWNVSFADKNSCVVFRTQTIAQAVSFAASNRVKTPAETVIESEPMDEISILPEDVFAAEVTEETVPETPPEAPVPELPANINVTKTPSRKRGRKPQSPEDMIRSALLGFVELSDDETAAVLKCAVGSEDKEDFHNALAKIFKNQATELYKVLRPKYLKLKEAIAEQESPAEETAEKNTSAEEISAPAPVTVPESPKETPKQKKKTARKKSDKPKRSKLAEALEKLLSKECSEDEIRTVEKLLNGSDTKQKFYLSVVKEYRKERGCEIYKLIKSEYTELEKLRETVKES
jgi:hypothetical protein